MRNPLKIEKHHHDETMSNAEIRRRFRWALVGYLILMAATLAGLIWSLAEQQSIKNQQATIKANQQVLLATVARQRQVLRDAAVQRRQIIANANRDCDIVVGVTGVFSDFIRQEIALRDRRAHNSKTPADIRGFDQAEVRYWTKVTLPKASRVLHVNCNVPVG